MKKEIKNTTEELGQLRKLYGIIINGKLGDDRIQERVIIIQYLKRKTRQVFTCADDFMKKMEYFIIHNNKMKGSDLKRVRKSQDWDKKEMADYLSIRQLDLSLMESGKKALDNNAVEFLHQVREMLPE